MSEIENMREWERNNQGNIFGWIADWEVKPGYKVVVFEMKDRITYKTFEIPTV